MTTREKTAPVPAADDTLTWDAYVERYGHVRMTMKSTAALFKVLSDKWEEMNDKNIVRNQRLDALEGRLTALEAKPSVKFCGTWERGKTYEPGEAVVRDGGLWICKVQTPGEPTKDFVGWQLAVRRGSVR